MVVNVEFKNLLENLQSQDNEVRNQAEMTYDSINAKMRFELLLQSISSRGELDQSVRIFAGVLCRRLLDTSYEESFQSLSTEAQDFTKEKLLQWIINDDEPQIRKKLSEIVVEIAQEHFDDNGNLMWTELLGFTFEKCLNSSDDNLKAIGLQMFGSLPNMLGDQLSQNMSSICQVFIKTMSKNDEFGSEQSLEVRVASVKTFASFIISQIDDDSGSLSQPQTITATIIPLMLHVIADSLTGNSNDDSCMKALVDLADSASEFLKQKLNDILELCMKILHNGDIDDSQKHLAVEVIVSLTENCPGAVRKYTNHMQGFIQILFKMLTDLDDDPEWATLDFEEEEDDSSPSIIAEMSLDRISCAMRGKKVLQEITHTVPAMLHSNKWQERHGGLMAISSCAEGLNKVMEEILGSIIDEIVPLLSDPHPRVRYAACNAVGQLSTDFGYKLQKAYHAKVVPGLLAVLDDNQNPRVQAYAGAAMVNFCEAAPKSLILLYLPVLTTKLLQVLQSKYQELIEKGRKLVLEQIVTTIAAVADSVGDMFAPYYDDFMQFLKLMMIQCDSAPQLRLLRGKTIECISLIGLAVGRDRFIADAQDVMQLLLKSQSEDSDGDDCLAGSTEDPQHSYMISAWARMCKLLGQSFAHFLPMVMKSVLKAAAIKPDVCMMYNDEADEIDKDWQVVKIADDQNFAIHTSGLENKATACQMLVCYARELTDAFYPYVQEVADIMIPLVKFYFNEEVRSSAAEIMPLLIDCSRPLGSQVTSELWNRMIEALLTAIPHEPSKPQIADMLDAIGEGIKRIGRESISSERMNVLISLMKDQFQEILRNQDSRMEKRNSEDYDEEDEELMEHDKDDDDNILCKLVDLMHALFLVYREDALPVFDELLCEILKLQAPGRPWTEFQYFICFWDDLIECVGRRSWDYCQHFLPAMIAGLRNDRKEIRQGSIYGFGLMAMHGGEQFTNILREVFPILIQLIEAPNSRDETMNLCTENAISALTKICKYRSECIPSSNGDQDFQLFLSNWLSWLPIWEDTEETPHVFGFLCDLVESNSGIINDCNLPHIIRSISYCLMKDGLSHEHVTYDRCINLVKMVQENGDCFSNCINALSKEEQSALQRSLEKHSDNGFAH